MPGLNFVFAFNELIERKSADYKAALNKTLFEDSHKVQVLFEDDRLLSSITSLESYPTRVFEKNEIKIYIEGRIYNLEEDAVNETITSIAQRLFQDDASAKVELSDWLLKADGEFLIFIYNKTANRILVINDIFGILPCYIYRTDWGVVFSRNFSFIAGMIEQKQFDKIAMAQFLVFRHTIGDRTFLKDVFRPKPAELVAIDANLGDVRREVLYTFNFEKKKYLNRSAKTNAKEIARLFTEGCRNRVDIKRKTIVSLSGGLDSRSDAAALNRAGMDFETRTFLDINGIASTDYRIARQVASALGVEWKSLKMKPMTGRNMLRTLKMKSGLVDLGKVFLIQMMDKIVSEYGHNVTLFLGLGGDRIAHDIRTVGSKKISSLKDFLKRSTIFMPFKTASELTGVSEKVFFDEIKKELTEYPEKSMSQKCVHFSFYGQTFKWHFEGHDRFRNFFWPASPFFSTPFFCYIMNCPDKQKSYLRLYFYFLHYLNPRMSSIPCARNEFLTPVSLSRSRLLIWYWYCQACHMYSSVCKWPNPIRFIIKRIKKLFPKSSAGVKEQFKHSPDLIKCMADQIFICRQKENALKWSAVENVVANCENYNSELLSNVFTVISMIEELSTGQSTLEKYQDFYFGSFNPTLYKAKPTENF